MDASVFTAAKTPPTARQNPLYHCPTPETPLDMPSTFFRFDQAYWAKFVYNSLLKERKRDLHLRHREQRNVACMSVWESCSLVAVRVMVLMVAGYAWSSPRTKAMEWLSKRR